MSYAPIFTEMKGLIKTYICGKFHLYSIYGSQVINVQMVLWQSSSHEMGHFEGVLCPFSHKYDLILLKFWPEVVCHEKKALYKQSSKMMSLRGNGTYPKFTVLDCFWDQFTPGKHKTLPKTKIFPETTALALSIYTSPRSHINLRILI